MIAPEMLRAAPLFAPLADGDLAAIAACARTLEAERDQIIVQEGEPGRALYVIMEGGVKIVSYSPDGREIVLALLGRGAPFGELALIDGHPRSATVIATEPSRLVQIRREEFLGMLETRPRLAVRLIVVLAERLRDTNRALARITGLDAASRVHAWLAEHARRHGQRLANGEVEVRLPPHHLIADQIATSRETVSRTLSALAKKGWIVRTGRRGVVRLRPERLAALVDALH